MPKMVPLGSGYYPGEGGIPTAEQEALQPPTIDPVFTAALGPTFGLRQMLESLAWQGVMSQMPGASRGTTMMAGVPGPNLVRLIKESSPAREAVQTMGKEIGDYYAQHGVEDISLKDEPDFRSMVGARGDVPQNIDTYHRLLRNLVGFEKEPYPYASIGRPVGLAAMIADIRHQLGFGPSELGASEVPNKK